MTRILLSVVLALLCGAAFAGPSAVPVRAEIHALLSNLEASGCQFSRNGSWFSGSKAKDHLLRKLEYIEGRTAVQSTEQFIELAASRSSSTGKPYMVKCGSGASVESHRWLTGQLAAVRAAAGKAKP